MKQISNTKFKICIIILLFAQLCLIDSKLQRISSELKRGITLNDISGWSFVPSQLTTCGQTMFGQFQLSQATQKTFSNLPPHYSIAYAVEFNNIRSLDSGDDVYMYIDNVQVNFLNGSMKAASKRGCNMGTPSAGWDPYERIGNLGYNITHTASSSTINFVGSFDQAGPDESWAFSRLEVWVDRCHDTCLTCNGPSNKQCLTCPSGSVKQSDGGCRCPSGTFAFENACVSIISTYQVNYGELSQSKPCPNNCATCSSLTVCTACNAGYNLMKGLCYNTCPAYTTLSNGVCTDTYLDGLGNTAIIQEFTNNDFTNQEILSSGWTFNKYDVYGSYNVQNVQGDICNGNALALGFALSQAYCSTTTDLCIFQKTFNNLPYHYGLNFRVQYYAGGVWTGEFLKIYIDGVLVKTQTHTSVAGTKTFNCGLYENYINYVYSINLPSISHTSDTVNISFQWYNAQNNSMLGWVGLRDFQIAALQCDSKCATCTNGTTCTTCIYSRSNPPNCADAAPGYFDDGLGSVVLPQCGFQCAECSGTPNNCTKCQFYDDPNSLPSCNKPTNCLKYASVRSIGYQHYQTGGVGGYTEFYINGVKLTATIARGINIVQLTKDGDFIEHKAFDTCGTYASHDALIAYIESIPEYNQVLVAVYDEGSNYLSDYAYTSLNKLGFDTNIKLGYRDAFAMIGRRVQVSLTPKVQQVVRSNQPKYAAYVEKCILECDQQCAECSGTPSNCTKCRYYQATAPNCDKPTNCLTYLQVSSADYLSGNSFKCYVNGAIPGGQVSGRGFNIVEMDSNGTIYTQANYDTYGSTTAVTNLMTKLTSLAADRIVVLGMADEASVTLNQVSNAYNSLYSVGWPQGVKIYARDPFSLIGYKGAQQSSILYKIGWYQDTGVTKINQCLKDCDVKCGSCSGTSSTCSTCSSNLRQSNCSLPTNCGKFAYIKSTGFNYSKYQSQGKQIKFFVNDIDVTFSQSAGLHFISFNGSTGAIDETKVFDYSSDTTILTTMISWINSLPTGKKVLIGCNQDMNKNMTSAGYIALQSLGLDTAVTVASRQPFAMMGTKGAAAGSATYQVGDVKPGAIELQICALGCQYQCQTCQMEINNCLSCSHSTRVSLPDCSCKAGYFEVGVVQCSQCSYKCSTCITSAGNCQTCSDINRENIPTCSCKSGYYDNGSSSACVICPNKFAACSSATVGITCKGINRTTTIPNCQCVDGYYDDGTNKSDCTKCDVSCSTCDTAIHCLTCSSGYYNDGVNSLCQKCPNKFVTCSSATVGISCQGVNRTTNIPNCQCVNGYYDDGTNKADCTKCDLTCSTCDTATHCLSCSSGYYNDGVNSLCQKCPNKFVTCSSATVGTSCQGVNRTIVTPNCYCVDGYYDDGTNKADCTKCNVSCSTCDTVSHCQTCSSGYYNDGVNSLCQLCPNKFATCSSATVGITCKGLNRTTNIPNCQCVDGYYDDGTNKADCTKCDVSCSTCDTVSHCQTCSDGYYNDGVNSLCQKCPNKFVTCSSATVGLSCQGINRTTNIPNCQCVDGYYDDGTNKADCTKCNISCSTCDTVSNCQTCSDGYYNDGVNSLCQKCPNKFATCSSVTVGTSCQGANRTIITPDCLCVDSYFDDGTNKADCTKCDMSICKTCKDTATNCLTCADGYYFNNVTGLCTLCPNKFETCESALVGISCKGLHRTANTPNCECSDGYFDDGTNKADCLPCDYTICATCQNTSTQCIICADITRGGDKCDCLQGYFEEGNAACGACNYKCESCVGFQDKCQTCSHLTRYNAPQCICIDTYYDDGINSECQKCIFPCLNCQNKFQCTSCQGQFRQGVNCQCQLGFYDNSQSVCEKCDIQCKHCQVSKNKCKICEIGSHRTLQVPDCGCQEGYYQIKDQLNCGVCNSNCKKCEDFTGKCLECLLSENALPDCLVTITSHFFETEASSNNLETQIVALKCKIQCETCEQQAQNCSKCAVGLNRIQDIPNCYCQDGYHDNNNQTVNCQKCSSNCKTCKSQYECLTCTVSENRVLDSLSMKCLCIKGYVENQNKECVQCYYYENQCYEKCPVNTIEDIQKSLCYDKKFESQSNLQTYIAIIGSFIVFQISLILFIRYKISNKFRIFKTFEKNKTYQQCQPQKLNQDIEENSS